MRLLSHVTTAVLLAAFAAHAYPAEDIRMVGVAFHKGADTADIADKLTGKESVMYRFRAKNGQFLQVALRPKDQQTDFILYAPGKWPGQELHNSETVGSREYKGRVDRDGVHAVKVFQRQNASLQGQASEFELVITLKEAEK